MHWRAISENPDHPAVADFLRGELARLYRGVTPSIEPMLTKFTAGESVLDIGVVAHMIEVSDDPTWRHGKIKRVARKLVGIDILEDESRALNERGYDVRVVDATSEADLGEKFDRVVVGDVIEHVDNPLGLLKFARRHLVSGGLAMFTTPNPFFIEHVLAAGKRRGFIPNAEHVNWISPTMALELSHRAEFPLVEYWHAQGEGLGLIRKSIVSLLKLIRWSDAELFNRTFVYVFKKAD